MAKKNQSARSGAVSARSSVQNAKSSAQAVIYPGLLSADSQVTKCENMRINSRGELESVGEPRVYCNAGDSTPLGAGVLTDGQEWLLLKNGNALSLYHADVMTPLGDAGSEPYCAVSHGDEITVMTAKGACKVTRKDDTSAWQLNLPVQFAGLHLYAGNTSLTSARFSAMSLPAPLTRWDGDLGSKNHAAISAAMRSAYEVMASGCYTTDRYCQPVLARVKLKDSDGNLLFTGPIVCLCASDGWQALGSIASTVTRNGDGAFQFMNEATMSINTYKLCLTLPGEAALTDAQKRAFACVATAEIYVTPQFHPFEPGGMCDFRCEGGGAQTGVLRMWMPGATENGQPLTARFTSALASALTHMEAMEQRVAVIPKPFSGERRTVTVNRKDDARGENIITEKSAITAVMSQPLKETLDTQRLNEFNAPHSFTARYGCPSGSNVAWGNLQRLLFSGYDGNALSAGTPINAVKETSIRVTLLRSNGTEVKVVNTSPGHSTSGALSPLLTYPDARAVKIEIKMHMTDGNCKLCERSLTPTPDGKMAYWLEYGAKQILPETSTGSYTPFTPSGSCETASPLSVAVAPIGAPTSLFAVAECADSPITGIIPSWRANATWDYASGRFYLLTRSGLAGVGVSENGKLRASLIDSRVPKCAVMTPHGVVAATGSDISIVGGTRAVTLLRNVECLHLGYDSIKDEIWVADTNRVTVISPATGAYYYRTNFKADSLTTLCGRLYITAKRQILLAGAEIKLLSSDIAWSVMLPSSSARHSSYTLDLRAENFEGEISVSGDNTLLHRLTLNGSLDSPLRARLLLPSRFNCSLSIHGRVAGKLSLRRIIINKR